MPSPEVGSGVHVRVKVDASLQSVDNPDGSKHYDGNVRFNVHFSFYDTDEGETDATFDDNDVVLGPGDPPYEKPYTYISADTVPERASGKIVIHVVPAVLAGTTSPELTAALCLVLEHRQAARHELDGWREPGCEPRAPPRTARPLSMACAV